MKADSKNKNKKLPKGPISVLVGTRKGAFILKGDSARKRWTMSKPILFGHVINHFVVDPRNKKTMIIGAKTGHLGPTVYRSTDGGKKWTEAKQPPAFAKNPALEKELSVERVFWITPGHADEPSVWYAGTAPAGLFKSEDDGATWEPVNGFNQHPMYSKWCATGATPDGQFLHSISVDPRDKRHLYLGVSIGGVFESEDGGATWQPLNKGCAADFLPDQSVEYGHDPHCVVQHPANPDRLYQQNHCGIYRVDRPDDTWTRIGKNMPAKIGDIGFPIVVHPREPDRAWVFPMDGTAVWPRTSPDGKPATFITKNAGKTWTKQSKGLPKSQGWFTVKRQAMTADARAKLGLYFGTTSGQIWASKNEGDSWARIAEHLPEIFSLSVAE